MKKAEKERAARGREAALFCRCGEPMRLRDMHRLGTRIVCLDCVLAAPTRETAA